MHRPPSVPLPVQGLRGKSANRIALVPEAEIDVATLTIAVTDEAGNPVSSCAECTKMWPEAVYLKTKGGVLEKTRVYRNGNCRLLMGNKQKDRRLMKYTYKDLKGEEHIQFVPISWTYQPKRLMLSG